VGPADGTPGLTCGARAAKGAVGPGRGRGSYARGGALVGVGGQLGQAFAVGPTLLRRRQVAATGADMVEQAPWVGLEHRKPPGQEAAA
jgi:hypothetical protein